MKFSIVLAVAALSAETFACANIGQVCQKGDPDVCQCDAPLTLAAFTTSLATFVPYSNEMDGASMGSVFRARV
ncbi:hypothetical protein BFJ63_vAg4993 [Fusarium oxysporum f. sp. narcissi]|uniref:Extracellular membrane protein CFEM domain-containing protein n=1 Tax=Fusarium oxysporum f. sp. narcissi TaxID=451672 RepID=A0A4V1S1J6_FUSOX|nr:hypothetical protein BFJ71_g2895 [Fusarium oxysporum]RYC92339.1 hypothetical protein BFJ63_vAg4993 [Fusarium oxysporum f. sp. narcissi]